MTASSEYYHNLEEQMTGVPDLEGVSHCRLEGTLLRIERWDASGADPASIPIDDAAEAFVLPLAGTVRVHASDVDERLKIGLGEVCLLPDAWNNRYRLDIEGGSFIVAAMPMARPTDAYPTQRAEPESFRFDDVLEDKYEGWRFFARDGEYMTVGCSYRTAPPPSQETPHTHPGEQFNVPLEGLFEMTIGGVTHEIEPGWVSHIPPETLHTGIHRRFPYFQLIFSTPPRGKLYDEFLAGIYDARIHT
jgi:mannose-6-phosphate isomerase-like protein (cupin superfamily)